METYQINEISRLLDAVSGLTGTPVVWKDSVGKGEQCLPERQKLHCNSFCSTVKKVKSRVIKCSYNDCVEVRRKAEELGRPFLNKCHAGAVELIVPIFHNGLYGGSVFFGPFREENTQCPYRSLSNEYEKLGPLTERLERSAGDIFAVLIPFIIDKKDKFNRKQLSEKTKDKRIQCAIEHIDSHFKKYVSASDTAEKCALSVSRFIHLFKKERGISFSEYIKYRRMEEAKALLAETGMRIFDVAIECGYTDQCYFGLVFRKSTGFSPGNYRKKFGKPPQA